MSNWTTMSSSSERDLRAGDPVPSGHLPCLKASYKSQSYDNFQSVRVVMNQELLE